MHLTGAGEPCSPSRLLLPKTCTTYVPGSWWRAVRCLGDRRRRWRRDRRAESHAAACPGAVDAAIEDGGIRALRRLLDETWQAGRRSQSVHLLVAPEPEEGPLVHSAGGNRNHPQAESRM